MQRDILADVWGGHLLCLRLLGINSNTKSRLLVFIFIYNHILIKLGSFTVFFLKKDYLQLAKKVFI